MKTLTVILTGGLSRRMGRDKATLPYRNGTLLSHMIALYTGAFDAVAVSADRAGRFSCAGALELADLYPGQGPLAGLHAAFSQTEAETVFLTGVDLPFGGPGPARALVEAGADYDACFLRRENGHGNIEPLFGAYRRSCLPALETCLSRGDNSFRRFSSLVKTRVMTQSELPGWDWDHILTNINRPEEYDRIFSQ
jgi:molybdopterin-guanine dinucleotide biosynthesis protein A